MWFVVATEEKYVLCYADFRKFKGNRDGILCVPGRTQEGRGLKDDEKFLEQLSKKTQKYMNKENLKKTVLLEYILKVLDWIESYKKDRKKNISEDGKNRRAKSY